MGLSIRWLIVAVGPAVVWANHDCGVMHSGGAYVGTNEGSGLGADDGLTDSASCLALALQAYPTAEFINFNPAIPLCFVKTLGQDFSNTFNSDTQATWSSWRKCPPPTSNPTTTNPTTSNPTTANPTTANPTTANPTTKNPSTANPSTTNPTWNPTTLNPTTNNPTTSNPTSSNPTTTNPTTKKPSTANPTSEPTTSPSPQPTPVPTSSPSPNPTASPTGSAAKSLRFAGMSGTQLSALISALLLVACCAALCVARHCREGAASGKEAERMDAAGVEVREEGVFLTDEELGNFGSAAAAGAMRATETDEGGVDGEGDGAKEAVEEQASGEVKQSKAAAKAKGKLGRQGKSGRLGKSASKRGLYNYGGYDELDTTIELSDRRSDKRGRGGRGGQAALQEGMDV